MIKLSKTQLSVYLLTWLSNFYCFIEKAYLARVPIFSLYIGISILLALLSSIRCRADVLSEDSIPTVVDTLLPVSPSSFDPLDAQNLQNFYAMSTLYARPIEFDDLGRYRSSLLENFKYLDKTHTLQFCLKDDRFFSDGSPIVLDDLAFNIARVAKKFPELTHIKEIQGLSDWLKLDQPLLSYPKGFQLTRESNCINIHYNSSQLNPFYNFVWSLHCIIPKSSVDLRSGQLKVFTPPFSGLYTLAQLSPDAYTLERRNTVAPSSFPEKILVRLVNPSKIGPILEKAHNNLVIIADKESLSPSDQKTLSMNFRSPPEIENRSTGLLFNTSPKHLFSDLRLRQFFAEEFRQSVIDLGVTPSGSIFTLIQPGYIPLQELRSHLQPFSPSERERLLEKLKKRPPIVGSGYSGFFYRSYLHTMQRLGIKQNLILNLSTDEVVARFLIGQIDMMGAQVYLTGLEPLNGPRQIISLGTVPLFKFLNQNVALHKALSKIYQTDPFTVDLQGAKKLSHLLFQDASYSIYRNFGVGTYILKNSPLKFDTQFLRMELLQFFSEARK